MRVLVIMCLNNVRYMCPTALKVQLNVNMEQ